jgi:hypothetical protein
MLQQCDPAGLAAGDLIDQRAATRVLKSDTPTIPSSSTIGRSSNMVRSKRAALWLNGLAEGSE